MLIIRLSRIGKKNHPHYRIVLAEKTYPVKGKFIELLGSYNPHQKIVELKEERIHHWLEKGVRCSDTVHNLLVKKGILKLAKIKFGSKSKDEVEKSEGEQQSAGSEIEQEEIKKAETTQPDQELKEAAAVGESKADKPAAVEEPEKEATDKKEKENQ